MLVDWSPLRRTLARLRAQKQSLPLWWRDDDAIKPTEALAQLAMLSDAIAIPVHIAVIPATATKTLADHLQVHQRLIPVVHGWRHVNNAPPDAKKSEFGTPRETGLTEPGRAHARMQQLFGTAYLPLFVPPWNRLDPMFLPALKTAGFLGVSAFTARQSQEAQPGLYQINTHVDPIDWRGTRGLKDPERLLAETITVLEARLEGSQDATEPFGFLTHHLVHSPQVWEFSRRFLTELLEGGAEVSAIAPMLESRK